jgi:hypothetical protein
MWAKGARAWDAKDSLSMTPEEKVMGSALCKLALNVCLMAAGREGEITTAPALIGIRRTQIVCSPPNLPKRKSKGSTDTRAACQRRRTTYPTDNNR